MKKIIAFVLVLATSLSVSAQDAASLRKHRFGLRIAPGISYFGVDKLGQENDGFNYAFGYGLQYEYALSENFSIVSGVLMNSFRGNVTYSDSLYFVFNKTVSGQSKVDTANQILSRKYTFKSVDIPLKLKLKTPEIGYLTYFGEFGTTLSVIYDSYTSKNEVILNEGDTKSELAGDEEKLDANDDVSWFRGSLNIGAGVEYNLVGNTSLLIGVNWNSAFTNILGKKSESLFYTASGEKFSQTVKADYVALTVGIQF